MSVPAQGFYDISYFTYQNVQTYTLITDVFWVRSMNIQLYPVVAQPPAPPYNVQGTVINPTTSQVTWNYFRLDTIEGFRLYRQSLATPSPPPVLVANETSLLPKFDSSWMDTLAQNCSYYYVVAIWDKLEWVGNVLTSTMTETEKSTNFWYTPCP